MKTWLIFGKVANHITGIPQTRAFWRSADKEDDESIACELQSIYAVVIANPDYIYEEEHDVSKDYAIVTWFTNGELRVLDDIRGSELDMVKTFISDMWEVLEETYPEKNRREIPSIQSNEELFKELISKLTPVNESEPIPPVDQDDDRRMELLKRIVNQKKPSVYLTAKLLKQLPSLMLMPILRPTLILTQAQMPATLLKLPCLMLM